jgi:hypothetical protein
MLSTVGCKYRPVPEFVLQLAVREAFIQPSQHYSIRQPRAEVQTQGHAVSRWRIRGVLAAYILRAQQPRAAHH